MAGISTFSQAQQINNSYDTEDEGDGDIIDIDRNQSYARAPLFKTTVGAQKYETSDDEMDDLPPIVTPQPPALEDTTPDDKESITTTENANITETTVGHNPCQHWPWSHYQILVY